MPAVKTIAAIADLVASRKIKNRGLTQETLQRALDQLNERSRTCLLSPYTLTLGDEFQAVLRSAETIFRDAFQVLAALYPVRVRFSFGVGVLETRINPHQAIGMDGPAFHNARRGMDGLKKSRGLFTVEGVHGQSDGLVRQSLALLGHSCRKWSRSRLDIFNLLLEEMPVKAMAERLSISDKAIYKSIDNGGLRIALGLLRETSTLIDQQLSAG